MRLRKATVIVTVLGIFAVWLGVGDSKRSRTLLYFVNGSDEECLVTINGEEHWIAASGAQCEVIRAPWYRFRTSNSVGFPSTSGALEVQEVRGIAVINVTDDWKVRGSIAPKYRCELSRSTRPAWGRGVWRLADRWSENVMPLGLDEYAPVPITPAGAAGHIFPVHDIEPLLAATYVEVLVVGE